MKKLLNIIQHANTNQAQGPVISLDTKKAVDHIEGSYLFTIMENLGLGEGFIKLINGQSSREKIDPASCPSVQIASRENIWSVSNVQSPCPKSIYFVVEEHSLVSALQLMQKSRGSVCGRYAPGEVLSLPFRRFVVCFEGRNMTAGS